MKNTITVCDKCLQASCWQGSFYCEGAKAAGTVEKTRDELTALSLEHPSYWDNEANVRAGGKHRSNVPGMRTNNG